MSEDYTKITNIQERRKKMMGDMVETICQPYNQYYTRHNINILKELITPMFNASLVGYEYQDVWEAQKEQQQDDAIERIFKISRTFKDITLTDEQYNIVANFAEAIRMVNTNNLKDIADAIEKYVTENFGVFSSPKEVLFILQCDAEIVEALLYYKLLPTNISSKTIILRIPPEHKDKKLWLWAVVPTGFTEYYMPTIGAHWIYTKEETPDVLSNPLLILPEWYYVVEDNL